MGECHRQRNRRYDGDDESLYYFGTLPIEDWLKVKEELSVYLLIVPWKIREEYLKKNPRPAYPSKEDYMMEDPENYSKEIKGSLLELDLSKEISKAEQEIEK